MTAKTLPEKDSDLLDLAVTDAIRASKKPGYRLNMGVWADRDKLTRGPNKGKTVCHVCMAGAVMTQTLGDRPTAHTPQLNPFNGHTFGDKLRRINEMRTGCFRWALQGTPQRAALDAARALVGEHYNDDTGRAPWRIYRKAAAILRGGGAVTGPHSLREALAVWHPAFAFFPLYVESWTWTFTGPQRITRRCVYVFGFRVAGWTVV